MTWSDSTIQTHYFFKGQTNCFTVYFRPLRISEAQYRSVPGALTADMFIILQLPWDCQWCILKLCSVLSVSCLCVGAFGSSVVWMSGALLLSKRSLRDWCGPRLRPLSPLSSPFVLVKSINWERGLTSHLQQGLHPLFQCRKNTDNQCF